MKISCLIPARGGSKGIPKKNLYPIAGKPLLWYTIDASKGTMVDDIYVSSDNSEIRTFAGQNGVVSIIRPPEYATDIATTESVIEHFTQIIDYDILVLIQPTSPMVRSLDIDRGIIAVRDQGYDSAFSVINTNDILLWDNQLNPVNYDPKNRGRRQDRISPYFIETGGFFITTRKQFLNSKCRMGGKIFFVEVDFWTWPQIDSIEDAKIMEKLLR